MKDLTATAMVAGGKVLVSLWIGEPHRNEAFTVQTNMTEGQARIFAQKLIDAADTLPRELGAGDIGL